MQLQLALLSRSYVTSVTFMSIVAIRSSYLITMTSLYMSGNVFILIYDQLCGLLEKTSWPSTGPWAISWKPLDYTVRVNAISVL